MEQINNQKKLREGVRILERRLGLLNEGEMACCNISLAQCYTLVEIGRMGSISLNELASMLNLDNSTMSRTVNNLVVKNLVERVIDPQDRRYVSISLTQAGIEIFKGIEVSMEQHFLELYSNIPEDKRNQVLESLDILNEILSKYKCC